MRHSLHIFSFVLTLMAFAVNLPAGVQTFRKYSFTHINTSNSNISYDGISKIMQDSRGYMWIGTFKGLNRYDGSRFDVYYKDALGLDSDFIHTIIEDSEGNLWVGTDNGVSRYIYKDDRFEAFTQKAGNGASVRNKVTSLYMDSRSRVWIIANYQGCFCYDPSDCSLVNYGPSARNTPEYYIDDNTVSFRRMVEDDKGGFWFSKYYSSLMYAGNDIQHPKIIQTPGQKNYFLGDQVEQMWFLDGKLLVASNNHGISSYSPDTQMVETLFTLPSDVTLVDAFLDSASNIWLCTTDGVWKYNMSDGESIYIAPDTFNPLSLSGHYVFSAYVDRDGGLWLGTKDGGVCYSGPFQNNFTKVAFASDVSLNGALITSFTTDDSGTVWISTEEKGLLRYNLYGNSNEAVAIRNKDIPKNLCFALYDEGKIWLGTFHGLLLYDVSSGKVKKYGPLIRKSGANDPRVYRGFKTFDGNLYFSNTLGLFRYCPDTDDFCQLPVFDGVFITDLTESSDGTLWASSYAQGLFHYEPGTDELIHSYRMHDESGLPSDKISSVIVDNTGRLWTIGFNCGISTLEPDGHFTTYNVDNTSSMPSNVFFSAEGDNYGNLWLSSDKGLVKCSLPTMTFTSYSTLDGLLDNKLTNSMLRLGSDDMFCGSDNGFVHFNPLGLNADVRAPRVILSKMDIGNRSFKGNVDLKDEIKLESDQNSFGFQFSVMSFEARADCHVRCRLEGYDDDWVDVSSGKGLYYFNVPSGTYTLRVMSSGDGYKWEECHAPVRISIAPTFFASFLGITLIILLFIITLLVTVFLVKRRQQRISRMEEENIRKETEEESFRDKMNFFSHVIHEIKTPLTLIKTPLQSIVGKEYIDDEARHDLQVMQSNTDYLTTLVNELLEFVRVERNGYTLNCSKIDITERLSSIIFNYQDTATGRNVKLNLNSMETHIWVFADSSALDKIINNVLINALKHADTEISVKLTVQEGQVALDIANDGDVIPREFVQDVFKPFVQYHSGDNKLRKGVGIGLPLARSLARMHSGELELLEAEHTTFRLTLPLCDAPDLVAADEGETASLDVREKDDARQVLLVVDDNAEMREFMCRKLGVAYTVMTARNADEAIAMLTENNVDLMVSDISMPGKDGLQLCREIRDNLENSHIPIIILSARTSVESKIRAMEAGADLYIEKPFDLEYLRISIKNILDRRSLMRKAIGSGMGDADITMFGLPKRDEEFFQTFDRIILENITNSDLSNDFLAEKLNMSQSTMIRKIRKMLSTSPSNYVRSKRLSIASKMLMDSHGNNITDICYGVGFTNVSYFAKCFKEQYGVTPSEWVAKS